MKERQSFREQCRRAGLTLEQAEQLINRAGPYSRPTLVRARRDHDHLIVAVRTKVPMLPRQYELSKTPATWPQFVERDIEIAIASMPQQLLSAAQQVLDLLLPLSCQDELIGDLFERYREDILPTRPLWSAKLWLARHAAGAVWTGCRLRRTAMVSVALEIARNFYRFWFR